MSDMLPAKIERVWLVDERGSAVEHRPKPQALSSGQRHYFYRLGLMVVDRFLKERGFRPNCEESNNRLSYEKSGVLIDVAIKKPDNIAYVTSFPGYEYKQETVGKTLDGQELYRVNAKVTTLRDIIGSDYIIQLIVSTHDNTGTRQPVFIPLPKTLENPARRVVTSVLGTLGAMCQQISKLQSAFTEKEVEQEVQSLPAEKVSADFLPLKDVD